MKLTEEVLIYTKKYQEIRFPLKFYSLVLLTLVLFSFGSGFMFAAWQDIRNQPALLAFLTAVVIPFVFIVLAAFSHAESKKCLK